MPSTKGTSRDLHMTKKSSAEAIVRNIRRKTRGKYSAEEADQILAKLLA
jgi:hypothetical protein